MNDTYFQDIYDLYQRYLDLDLSRDEILELYSCIDNMLVNNANRVTNPDRLGYMITLSQLRLSLEASLSSIN